MAGIVEISELIKHRIGWRDDQTLSGFVLTPDSVRSDGQRFYQDAHPAVTLKILQAIVPIKMPDDAYLNEYLLDFKRIVAQRVLSDVYDSGIIPQNVPILYPDAFDRAMMLMGVIRFSEVIFTSTERSSAAEKFSKDFVAKLHYDIFREAPNKFATKDANYSHALGITTQYSTEINSLQRRFGKERNSLGTATAGQAIPNFYDVNPN